jgi:acetyl-CoA synthase
VFALAIQGAQIALDLAEKALQDALSQHGPEQAVEYPETCYELPAVFAWDGREAKSLGQLGPILRTQREKLGSEPTIGNALAAGEDTMIAAEVIEALKYIESPRPTRGRTTWASSPTRSSGSWASPSSTTPSPARRCWRGGAPTPTRW